jgi:hypothetical protein
VENKIPICLLEPPIICKSAPGIAKGIAE